MACVGVGVAIELPAATGTAAAMLRVVRAQKSIGKYILVVLVSDLLISRLEV